MTGPSNPPPEPTTDVRGLLGRSRLARWLAGVLAGEVDPRAVAPPPDLPDGPVSEAARRLVMALDAAPADGTFETERTRLFVNARGGVPAPPYASWWLDGELSGASTRDVERAYADQGLAGGTGIGPADYLPAELEFVHFLLQHQIAAVSTGSPELAAETRRAERRFLDDHMTRWLPAFCAAACGADARPEMIATLDLLQTFIEDEARRARSPLA